MENNSKGVVAILSIGLWLYVSYLTLGCKVNLTNEAIPLEARILIGVLYLQVFAHSWVFKRKRND